MFLAAVHLDWSSIATVAASVLATFGFFWSSYNYFIQPWMIKKGLIETTGSKLDRVLSELKATRSEVSASRENQKMLEAEIERLMKLAVFHDELQRPTNPGEPPRSWCQSDAMTKGIEDLKRLLETDSGRSHENQQLLLKITMILEDLRNRRAS